MENLEEMDTPYHVLITIKSTLVENKHAFLGFFFDFCVFVVHFFNCLFLNK